MTVPTIVTGDDMYIPVTLKKNGATFAISQTGTVKARVVTTDHFKTLTVSIDQQRSMAGADWANSLVVVNIPSAQSATITQYGQAVLEIQVTDPGKTTWFANVNVIKGNID